MMKQHNTLKHYMHLFINYWSIDNVSLILNVFIHFISYIFVEYSHLMKIIIFVAILAYATIQMRLSTH